MNIFQTQRRTRTRSTETKTRRGNRQCNTTTVRLCIMGLYLVVLCGNDGTQTFTQARPVPGRQTHAPKHDNDRNSYQKDGLHLSSPFFVSCQEDAIGEGGAPRCTFQMVPGQDNIRVCLGQEEDTECWTIELTVTREADKTEKSNVAIPNTNTNTIDHENPVDTTTSNNGNIPQHNRASADPRQDLDQPERKSETIDTKSTQSNVQAIRPIEERVLDGDTTNRLDTEKTKIPSPIQVGPFTYNPPFDEFGKTIQLLLQKPRYDSVVEEAKWLHSLGLAFQQLAEEQLSLNLLSNAHVVADDWLQRAVAAFQEALLCYKEAIDERTGSSGQALANLELQLKQALVYMELAKTHQLSTTQSSETILQYLHKAESNLRSLYETTVSTKHGNTQFGIELIMSYAEASLRLGAALLQSTDSTGGGGGGGGLDAAVGGVAAVAEEWLLMQAGDDYESILTNPKKIENMVKSYIPPLVAKTHAVIKLFTRSKTLWWNLLVGENNVKAHLPSLDSRQGLQHLATAMQNLGNAWLTIEQYEEAVLSLEEAWQLQEEMILPQLSSRAYHAERDAMLVAMGENLYSLADVYLRMGEYDKALDRYKRSMDWFQRYNIAPPQSPPVDNTESGDDQANIIQTYEQALEEYHAMFLDGVDSSDPVVSDSNGFYSSGDADYGTQEFFQRNDGYEGDLHNTLGAFYLNIGDLEQAKLHLQQALRLYLKAGEAQDATTATTYTQLALLHFQQGEYEMSTEQHRQSVEIFRKIVSPGTNPLHHGGQPLLDWPELLSEALRDLPDVNADVTTLLDVSELVEPIAEPFSTELGGEAGAQPKVPKEIPQAKDPSASTKRQETTKQPPKIHVDLDAFNEALLANRSVTDEL